MRKLLALFPPHPEPTLSTHWQVTQLSLILLPFSPLLGGVTLFVNSVVLWTKYANQLVQRLANQVLLLLGAWMIIIALFADRKDFSLPGLFNFLPFFIACIAQSFLFQDGRQLRQLARLIIIPSLPIAILAVAQLWFGLTFNWKILSIGGGDGLILDWVLHPQGEPAGRASSLFYYATILASYLVITFTLTLGLWIEAIVQSPKSEESPKRGFFHSRLGLGFVLVINGLALVLTQSRNAWGVAVGEVAVFAFVMGHRWVVAAISAGVVAVLEAAYAPPPLNLWFRMIVPRAIWARINDEMFANRPPALMRVNQWKFTIDLIHRRPLTGWGLRNFTPLYESAHHIYLGHPHNLPLMLASEMGIPATLIFYTLIGTVLAQSILHIRSRSGDEPEVRSRLMILLAFLGCTAFSFFDVPIFDSRINLFGWMLLSALWGLQQKGRPNTVDRPLA